MTFVHMSANRQTEDRRPNVLVRVWRFYADGFKSMTVGKTLWAIIALKVVIFFVILRTVFFPDFLASKADGDDAKADYVRGELIHPHAPDSIPGDAG